MKRERKRYAEMPALIKQENIMKISEERIRKNKSLPGIFLAYLISNFASNKGFAVLEASLYL